MYLVMIGALSAVILSLSIQSSAVDNSNKPRDLIAAKNQLSLYRAFAYAADQYVKANPHGGGGLKSITWEDLALATTTPPGMRALSIPDTWTVRQADSRWAICAELDEPTVAMMQQLLPESARGALTKPMLMQGMGETSTSELIGSIQERLPTGVSMPNAGALTNTVVTGEADPSEGVIYAAMCQ